MLNVCNLPAVTTDNRVKQICRAKCLVVIGNNNISILIKGVFWSFHIVLATGKDSQNKNCKINDLMIIRNSPFRYIICAQT